MSVNSYLNPYSPVSGSPRSDSNLAILSSGCSNAFKGDPVLSVVAV